MPFAQRRPQLSVPTIGSEHRERLAETSGVPLRTLARMEMEEGVPRCKTLSAIHTVLEAAGVEFSAENGGGAGVRLRKTESGV